MISLHSDPIDTARPRVRTTVGVPVGARPRLSPEGCLAVRLELERGAFLAAFEEVSGMRDISSDPNRVNLVMIRDTRILERFDAIVAGRRAR